MERKLSNEEDQQAKTDKSGDELQTWVRVCKEAAEEKLAKDTRAFYVGDVLGISDWFVVASGSSDRQVRAIVDEVEEKLALAGGPKPIRIEGKSQLSWVLMDYGMIVVHVFTEEARAYYDLDRLWSDVPQLDTESSAVAKTPASTKV